MKKHDFQGTKQYDFRGNKQYDFRGNKQYDFLIVGAGLFGAVFAHEAAKQEKSCLVIDKRPSIGGNLYCKNINGINVHQYGAHIFHTSNQYIWDYVNRFTEFNHFINSPLANYKGELYNLPFNMHTFHKLWGVISPEEAKEKIRNQITGYKNNVKEPQNLEEQAISLIGTDIYEKLIKGYTEKQWGRDCRELPSFIIKRLPVRYTYNNNYFNDRYQGIPIGGYNKIIKKMLSSAEVSLGIDYIKEREYYNKISDKILFTGMIDEYFGFSLGILEYRSLDFNHEILETDDYQGVAVVNYTDREVPYTRIIEHKHFEFNDCPGTVITKEYPCGWTLGKEPFYPVNDEKNQTLYDKYAKLAEKEKNVMFGGRLAEYKYYDMDKTIESALSLAKEVLTC